MADESVQPLVYLEQGGAKFIVASGGTIDIETGGKVLTNGTQATALTTKLTTLTATAPGSADYAIQDLTNTGPYGFVSKDEGNSVLAVIINLQTRVNELESKLQALGLIA